MNEFSSNDFGTSTEANRHDICNITIKNEPTEINNSYKESQFVGEFEYEHEYMEYEYMEKDQEIIKNIKKYLLGVEQTGHFSCGGLISGATSPGLYIDGIGYVGFPLGNDQMQNVISKCKMAPFGRGEKTLTDLNVRHTWQMEPSQFKILNPKWDSMMKNIMTVICDKLVYDPKNVKHSLYKLLIYGQGSFFKPHCDTEKEHGMFGTLVIVLPNSYSGGQLIVRHNGEVCEYDFSDAKNVFETKYAVFYADCEHEIKPVTHGYRVCLVYNLVNTSSDIPPSTKDDPVTLQNLIKAVNDWSLSSDNCTGLLAYALEHRYSNAGLSFSGLKGRDVVIARMLKKVSESVPLDIYLTNVVHVNVHNNYTKVRTNILNWISMEGKRPPEIERVSIRIDDMVQENFWESIPIDKEESIDTGNQGVDDSRIYHRSAIIFWPPKIKLRKYIGKDPRHVIVYLKTLQDEDDIRKATSIFINNLEKLNKKGQREGEIFSYGYEDQLYDLYDIIIHHNCVDQAIKFMILTEDVSRKFPSIYEKSLEALQKLHKSYPTIYKNNIFRKLAYRAKNAFESEAIKNKRIASHETQYLYTGNIGEKKRKAMEVLKMLDTNNFFESKETDLSIVEPRDVFMDEEMVDYEELDELGEDRRHECKENLLLEESKWPYEYEENLLLEMK